MLYLLHPEEPLRWAMAGPGAFEHLVPCQDVGGLGWVVTTVVTMGEPILGVALRRGVPVAQGIVVEGRHVAHLERARTNLSRRGSAEAAERLGQLVAGRSRTVAEMQRRVEVAYLQALSRARPGPGHEELVDPSLVAHWRGLGGGRGPT